MTLHKISGCKALDFDIIGNLQFELVSTKSTVLRSLKLDQLGPVLDETAECWTFTVEDGERVAVTKMKGTVIDPIQIKKDR